MEISAIMNIHELAMNREVKQKANSQLKKNSGEVKNGHLETEQIAAKQNTVSQVDAQDSAKDEKNFTGNFVNIVT